MEKIIEISSLEDYISKIKTIKNGHTFDFYYRGQNSKEYRLLPAIIREKLYYANESTLFNKFLSEAPDLFINCDTNYDRLTLMQHHQLPTRLLDVTKNPLVALFFACLGNGNMDGSVYIFSGDTESTIVRDILDLLNYQGIAENIKNFSKDEIYNSLNKTPYSDEIELESSLIRINKENRNHVLREVNRFYEFLKKSDINWCQQYKKWVGNNKTTEGKMESDVWENYKKLAGFGSSAIQKLFHEAKKDVIDFRVMMNPIQFILPKLVSSRLIDQRIKNQKGLFIFTPFVYDKDFNTLSEKTEKLINILRIRNSEGKMIKLQIPASKKKRMLEDLSLIGIDLSFIYPDDYSNTADNILKSL